MGLLTHGGRRGVEVPSPELRGAHHIPLAPGATGTSVHSPRLLKLVKALVFVCKEEGGTGTPPVGQAPIP